VRAFSNAGRGWSSWAAQLPGEAIAQELGAAARFVPTDVTSPDQVAQAMQQTVAAFGALHIVVNCAAVGPVKKIVGSTADAAGDVRGVVRVN